MPSLFIRRALPLCFALTTLTAFAGGTATVSLVSPEKFTDAGYRTGDQKQTLNEITQHLEKLAKRQLKDGQTVRIDLLDVKLAGNVLPVGRMHEDIRILNGGADWPTIKLRYSLEENGKVIRSGEESISDMNYQMQISKYNSSEPLHYEKQMLDDWFKSRIVEGRPAKA